MLVFRLAEIPRIILIHDRFKKVFGDEMISGLQTIYPEEWDGFDGYK